MKNVKRETIKALVKQTEGKIFKVTHLRKKPKLNKETGITEYYSTLECRTGVTKHLKGGESTIRHIDDLISVYAMQRNKKGQFEEKGYRSFSADLVKEIRFQGKIYHFEES